MKRVFASLSVAALLAAVALGFSACQKKVEVSTGTKVVCSYGHTVSDDIRTIEVPADEAAAHKVRTSTVVCDRHKKLEALYGEAQKALGDGDTTTAKAKLTQIVAAEKTFGDAQKQLDDINAGKKPAPDSKPTRPDTGSTPKPDNPGDGDTSVPSGSLTRWMPDSLEGFTASKPIIDVLSVSRSYTAASDSKAFTLVIAAEQYRTSKDASAALERRIKSAYTKDKATLKVAGHSVYFGTDGRQFAAAGFTDGAVMVALEMSARDGTAPKALRGLVEGVLDQLP